MHRLLNGFAKSIPPSRPISMSEVAGDGRLLKRGRLAGAGSRRSRWPRACPIAPFAQESKNSMILMRRPRIDSGVLAAVGGAGRLSSRTWSGGGAKGTFCGDILLFRKAECPLMSVRAAPGAAEAGPDRTALAGQSQTLENGRNLPPASTWRQTVGQSGPGLPLPEVDHKSYHTRLRRPGHERRAGPFVLHDGRRQCGN